MFCILYNIDQSNTDLKKRFRQDHTCTHQKGCTESFQVFILEFKDSQPNTDGFRSW